ncbi:hypothetical protein CEP52_010338 [Fusarium oligoseptatum]|uniref:Uncharacterized protein n=2 Tax=Fusarium solani species complex TaxID=232080 RepID=A0A428T8W8_9HYPO|nr:hypothetical protein CEP51_011589 [Fusarium floridanum]RSL98473.1 hypothetical protein CEP52_010338 [Fusarium oligoseptatum]
MIPCRLFMVGSRARDNLATIVDDLALLPMPCHLFKTPRMVLHLRISASCAKLHPMMDDTYVVGLLTGM